MGRLAHQVCVTCLYVSLSVHSFILHAVPGGAVHNLAFAHLFTPFGATSPSLMALAMLTTSLGPLFFLFLLFL